MLSALTATEIVIAVAQSSKSRKRIDSPLAMVLPNGWGWTGSVRNIGMMFSGYDGSEPEAAELSCVGIADSTSDDINAAKIDHVKVSSVHNRPNTKTQHTATLVVMDDGTEYIFDWHSTLQSSDPKIYRKADWDRGYGGVLFSLFNGFS